MTMVLDASVVVAALIDTGPDGRWAEEILAEGPLFAPALMPFEAANVIRRAALAGLLSADAARAAQGDLLAIPIDLHSYEALAPRIWELHRNLTVYDASYVALAEACACPLATLDAKLRGATGPRCRFRSP